MIKIPLFLGLFWSLGFGFQPAFAGERRAAAAREAPLSSERQRRGFFEREREGALFEKKRRGGFPADKQEKSQRERSRKADQKREMRRNQGGVRLWRRDLLPEVSTASPSSKRHERERALQRKRRDRNRQIYLKERAKERETEGFRPQSLPYQTLPQESAPPPKNPSTLPPSPLIRNRPQALPPLPFASLELRFSLPFASPAGFVAAFAAGLSSSPAVASAAASRVSGSADSLSPLCAREAPGAALSMKKNSANNLLKPPLALLQPAKPRLGRRALMKNLRTTPLDLIVRDTEGAVQDLYCHKGKRPVVVNLWATWCPPCIEELPSLARLAEQSKGKVFVLAISKESSSVLSRFRKRAFPDLSRELKIASLAESRIFPEDSLPVTYIFRKNGRLYRKEAGAKDWGRREILQELLKL